MIYRLRSIDDNENVADCYKNWDDLLNGKKKEKKKRESTTSDYCKANKISVFLIDTRIH